MASYRSNPAPNDRPARPAHHSSPKGAPAQNRNPHFNSDPSRDRDHDPSHSRATRPASTHWGRVAAWYDQLVGDDGSEYHKHVVFPQLLDLLQPEKDQRILDIACGQGVFCRILHQLGVQPTGVDLALPLIKHAIQRSDPSITFRVGDAMALEKLGLPDASFDAAACILAIQNIPSIVPVFRGCAKLLKPRTRLVIVMMHPAFRGPKIAGWQWDEPTFTQRRWISHYLSRRKEAILTHPGQGEKSDHTWSFHRPIQDYVDALARAGLLIDAIEEWTSHKVSDSGPRAKAENVSREEIPMFMAIRAVKF